ncbi:small fragment nuclease isoform X4 [Hippocampus comes]|uniref:small fragment nuclease isoform X4 n=1 Tax=Hippocampus comes TaxID=109280 RepID=UPI00094E0E52|nr:PREDICTED: oligoribonuclease, mitochondrial isoform X4 [Hippocampus comes]
MRSNNIIIIISILCVVECQWTLKPEVPNHTVYIWTSKELQQVNISRMTGLDIENDMIMEMACIITDSNLNILAEGPNLIIAQSNEILESMSKWCTEHHGKSGLTEAVRQSKITLEQAEYEFLSFVRQHTPPGQCPLAGNSVHADKRFLDKYMPQFMNHLHYRIIDVSTIKELCRALEDIRESIKELQYYRASIFKAT